MGFPLSKAGMHNIRPAGQMWPAEPCDLARKALNFVYFACFFDKNTLWMDANLANLALPVGKNKILARYEIWVVHPCSKGLYTLDILAHNIEMKR